MDPVWFLKKWWLLNHISPFLKLWYHDLIPQPYYRLNLVQTLKKGKENILVSGLWMTNQRVIVATYR